MADEILGPFQSRHIGPGAAALEASLRTIRVPPPAALIYQTIPAGIRLGAPLDLPAADSEAGYLRRLSGIAARNVVARSYIGMGYYDCVTPSVILRNVF